VSLNPRTPLIGAINYFDLWRGFSVGRAVRAF